MKKLRDFFSLANIVSLARIPFGIVVRAMMIHHFSSLLIAAVGIIGSLTDLFDGKIARRRGTTRSGEILDPVCDKAYVALCASGLWPLMPKLLAWPLAGCEAFFAAASLIAIFKPHWEAKAGMPGKIRFWAECLALLAFQFNQTRIGAGLLFIALVLSPFTAWDRWKHYRAHQK